MLPYLVVFCHSFCVFWELTMFKVDWTIKITDEHLENFEQLGFFFLDDVFENQEFLALQTESGFVDYKKASLTNGEQVVLIRGDNIRWIDEKCKIGLQYLNSIDDLGKFFNSIYYLGIKRSEAHYAHYPAGFGYQWHSDNPKGRDERVISAVFYLNDDWGEMDGGQISLIDKKQNTVQLLPKANRLIIFDSNLIHQVEITNRIRYSIATWLRRDFV